MSDISIENTIPLSQPEISGNEWKYVKECLDTGWVSSVGTYVTRFENTVANYIGSKYAVATVNGTSALHVSLIACDVKPNDEVIVPTLTFIAPVNAVRYCGAYPVFMDCDKDTLCIDVKKVTEFLAHECEKQKDGYSYNKKTKRRIKAIIPVHIFGHPADMDELNEASQKHAITIIEDAAESIGAEYKRKKTGGIGNVGCFSFNGNKIITTGGGGMVVTNEKELFIKVRHLTNQAKADSFEYLHDEVGYNYRLTNIQAAMGVAQMEKLEEFINLKRKNAAIYWRMFEDLSEVEFLWEKPYVKSNSWFYTIRVKKRIKKELINYLLSKKIQVRPIWKLIHTLPMYTQYQTYFIEKSEEVYESCINLPCSVNLKEADIEYVATNILEYLKKYG